MKVHGRTVMKGIRFNCPGHGLNINCSLDSLTPFLNQSWIFCVDNKVFSSALFEYYLDIFNSASQINTLDSDAKANKERWNSSKVNNWMLHYIVHYGQHQENNTQVEWIELLEITRNDRTPRDSDTPFMYHF